MKTTMANRTTANPRRTTLAHLDTADEIARGNTAELTDGELPAQTANPRRTVLNESPDA
ncbi:hypothetical protein [Streptomyces sp. TR06-5]|uniref:hypothetical protein n=1 Tax=Streptomyces sp. TR06-5 TaxID=3385976 RepID=UPI0039A3E8C2